MVDFASLRETNGDIIAWLYQEDTAINYPVMQTDNNDYYLTHLFDGTYSKVGAYSRTSRTRRIFRIATL